MLYRGQSTVVSVVDDKGIVDQMSDDPRLQKLLDRAEITDLMVSFGAALDNKDWAAYANCFTEDGSFTIMGQTRHGREAIADGPARDLTRYDGLQHIMTNHRITIDGDRATSINYLFGIHIPDASNPGQHADIGARYDCQCVRTPDGWKLAEAEITPIWEAGLEFRIAPVADA